MLNLHIFFFFLKYGSTGLCEFCFTPTASRTELCFLIFGCLAEMSSIRNGRPTYRRPKSRIIHEMHIVTRLLDTVFLRDSSHFNFFIRFLIEIIHISLSREQSMLYIFSMFMLALLVSYITICMNKKNGCLEPSNEHYLHQRFPINSFML